MNDPNRKIDVNISSLLSLKAELLRKQNDVNRAKSLQAAQPFVPKSFEKLHPKKTVAEPKSKPRVRELEDNAQLERSRAVLEAKAKFYDRMTASGWSVNSDEKCLVMFNQKKQNERTPETSSESEDDDEKEEESPESVIGPLPGDTGDWVEYVDSLGRTRKCLRTDLEFFKKRDEALVRDIGGDKRTTDNPLPESERKIATPEILSDSESEDELLKTGRQIQEMRDKWEQQEEENKDKEFVHYQDVLFNEARTHGVSYFQFSSDAEERLKQQKELERVRQGTLDAQKEREDQRSARERIIAERVLAAKNRQRARIGLPPLERIEKEEPAENPKEEGPSKEETLQAEKTIAEMQRKAHLRPWDEGKEGTSKMKPKEWVYKGEREPMSQEEWNRRKREERKSEFAPVESLGKSNKSENREESIEIGPSKWAPKPTVNKSFEEDMEEYEEEKPGLYFTSKKKLKRKNYQPEETESTSRSVSGGAEVPPPPTFEYYGPPIIGSGQPKRTREDSQPNIENSIAAGLQFLRNQTDKSKVSGQSLWGANANYGKDT